MKIKEVIAALEQFAPLPLQEGWDNAGLQVGLTEADVSGALLCLDVTPQIVDEAIASKCNVIVSHHPLIFHKLSCVSDGDDVQRVVMKAIQHGITIVSMHTNMDNAMGGVNFKIAEKIGLKNVRILEAKENALVKLTTFVPTAQAEDVRKALFDAGCGNIGNYDLCSYNMEGEGTFRAREGATPYCGAIGELHTEREVRIETIIPAYKKAATVKALLGTSI